MELLSHIYLGIQRMLLPALNEEMGVLTTKERRLVAICEVSRLEAFMEPCAWLGNGRKPKPRLNLARAFLAKALWNLPTTRAIIDRLKSDTHLRRLCGWKNGSSEVPDEATFSRAFAHFAQLGLGSAVHEQLITTHLGGQIHLAFIHRCHRHRSTQKAPRGGARPGCSGSPCHRPNDLTGGCRP